MSSIECRFLPNNSVIDRFCTEKNYIPLFDRC